MDQQNQQIKRVLALCDFACATGFAQIAEHVIAAVAQTNRYQIDIVGINYFGMPTQWQQAYPTVRVFPAHFTSQGDVFGRRGFMQMLSSGQYDLAWILQDTFNIEPIAQSINDLRNEMAANGKKTFKWVFYYPIDAAPKENWITKSVSLADYPVAYTKYGYTESVKYDKALEDRLRVIPHGIDLEDFKPLPEKDVKEFRHSYFNGLADDKFLVVNVNRNQPRKDIPSTMQAFKLLKQQVPNALLYLHMKKFDAGWNLDELARNYELAPELDWIAPENFDEHEGLPVQVVNALYNAADVVMTTTYGEGWGLSLTEAMAVGKIVVAPDQTSCHEIVEGHGILVPAGRGVTGNLEDSYVLK